LASVNEKENYNIIEVKNLAKSYGKNQVLNDVSVSLKAGQIIGLLGLTVAAKLHLLKFLQGLSTTIQAM